MKITRLLPLALLAGVWLSSCKGSQDKLVEIAFRNEAEAFNKKCPITVDAETRLDSVTVIPVRTIVYHYTLVNYRKDQFDINKVKGNMEPGMRETVKTSPDLAELRKRNANFLYLYRDNTNQEAFRIEIKAEDYNKDKK